MPLMVVARRLKGDDLVVEVWGEESISCSAEMENDSVSSQRCGLLVRALPYASVEAFIVVTSYTGTTWHPRSPRPDHVLGVRTNPRLASVPSSRFRRTFSVTLRY